MKIMKLLLVVIISFGLGIAVSRNIPSKVAVKPEGDGAASDSRSHKTEKAEEHHEESGEIEINEKSQGIIGLKTEKSRLVIFKKKIPVVGQIAQDVETSVHVVSPVSGEIAEMKAQIGSFVNKGDVLCTVSKINGETVIHEVRAPIAGTIIGAFAKVKDRVDTVSSVYTIADLTKLMATFDVYEKDIAEIKLAQKVLIYSVAYPGKVFEGEVTFISPRVDADANTIKVRAFIQNPDNYLKLGMFINADILIESEGKSIVLPQEAVYTINAKKVVCVKTAVDKFEAREVKVQDETKEEVSLAAGVSEGEEVVVQNGFLLKSELLKSKMGEGCAE